MSTATGCGSESLCSRHDSPPGEVKIPRLQVHRFPSLRRTQGCGIRRYAAGVFLGRVKEAASFWFVPGKYDSGCAALGLSLEPSLRLG